MADDVNPWRALWALVLGFFMILVDSTIVSVATPAIMRGLGAGVNEVVWVTSAYLLAYAVPLLISGRLGDRIGPFALVFGIQEGQSYDWGTIRGPITVWSLIIAGVVVMAAFTVWQRVNRSEPLLPLGLFRDRNFSLANLAITTVGFGITAMAFPLMLYAQAVRGLSPTKSALLLVPMAVVSGGLAPYVGKLTDRAHPRYLAGFGLLCFPLSLVWLSRVMTPDAPIVQLLLPIALMGVANGFMWAPLGTTATRNLPMTAAGAGAGVYNTTRQVGSVLGSASIAALMESRLAAHLPGMPSGGGPGAGSLPPGLKDGFSTSMAESLLLPAGSQQCASRRRPICGPSRRSSGRRCRPPPGDRTSRGKSWEVRV